MKVETPQILWHQVINPTQKKEAGKNSPILSCSLLDCQDGTGVLATAGNTEVNLWRVNFIDNSVRTDATKRNILVKPQIPGAAARSNSGAGSSSGDNDVHMSDAPSAPQLSEHTRIEHMITLTRGTNERNINAVKFSPDGYHLAAAGDGGTIVVWLQSWKQLQQETDLQMKIIFNQSDDVMDIAWSSDSKRFTVCSLDHTLTVWENVQKNNEMEWRNVHRSGKDHTHYIQGVAVDPKGVYMASQGSDRMVKVYTRKTVKENVMKGEMNKYEVVRSSETSSSSTSDEVDMAMSSPDDDNNANRGMTTAEHKKIIRENKVLPNILTNSTFALSSRTKTLKFLNTPETNDGKSDNNTTSTTPNPKRHHMFVDELTAGSFFRRLAFTPDGAFLIVPAALWHGTDNTSKADSSGSQPPGSPTSVMNSDKLAGSSFATYLFVRHHFEQPYKVLTGLEKPSVVIRPNPMLFQLPAQSRTKAILPYRSIFAVLTIDTVLIYDTHHNVPLAMARGLHYAGLTDASCSDGYVSILSFGEGELGEVYHAPEVEIVEKSNEEAVRPTAAVSEIVQQESSKKIQSEAVAAPKSAEKKVHFSSEVSIQQVPAGPTVNTLAPRKKPKKAPVEKATISEEMNGMTLEKESSIPVEKAIAAAAAAPAAVSAPVVNILQPKKKKKKIAPTLVSASK
ncbi:WD40 repeat domain-containing protein [Skeletonema marinoi]|uniref:WD40 repeat domain-containing protein n=1 Tax=Skeletonema marinoi TaxID=267567 RepID=A0AAD8YE33_9STRA|nr:WD40 repeat domain-containing protein [Skeletonema marinoi]